MALYRLYIDEVGTHDLKHVDDPNERFLSLTGVIIECEYSINNFQHTFNFLKAKFFQKDPDIPVIFHRKELVNKAPPFEILRRSNVEEEFNKVLLENLRSLEFHVITVVIDKKAHKEKYHTWTYHPYHYCLMVMLERYVLFLHYSKHRGDVYVEKRGGKEDETLIESYERLFKTGSKIIKSNIWQACLTSSTIHLREKKANINGLQLADIIAHPSRRDVLLEKKLIEDPRDIFGNKICEILNESKYIRNPKNGEIYGYGKKLLP